MDKMTQILDIPSIKNDTNFWMVRAKRGFFFDEFIRNEFIAIGWNSVTKAMISQNLTRSQSDRLKASIKATYDESKPGTSLNKCIRFCYELKAGDIAVIVDNNRVAFAYIGEYYEEQSPTLTVELEKEVHQQIEKANPNTDTFTCPYIKRRKITLIKVLTADDTISPYLQSAIARNWHSLSDLNEYAELVLSGCFDTVLFKDKITVTFRVKRKEEINVLDLANFVLCAARLLSDDKPETVQVKTTLHSPGDVILQIWNFAQENAFPLLICYMAIFGGKAGDYEFHSIIGVIKGIINHKYDEDKKKIELRKLSAEADLAEQQGMAVIVSFLIFSQIQSAGSGVSALRLVGSSIDHANQVDDIPEMDQRGTVIRPEDHEIVFDHVNFSYGSRPILKDVSLTIPDRTTTAIVGPSGSGKTTLCNLIARFWDVDGGRVTIGGRDVREYTLESLMEQVSMVFQRVYLFADTVENNIKFGCPDATHEQVVEVAKKACCHDFISALPDGYNTVIGEGGATLSGGEKQRISIARCLLKDAPIVIFDEATANVDPENEDQLQRAMEALTREKTVLMIAHRLKTVRGADQILVLDQGSVVQKGTHDELIQQAGIYRDFVSERTESSRWTL